MGTFWKVIGTALLVWVAYDLFAGYTLLYSVVYRAEEPVLYWVTIAIWTGLGVSCFYSWGD